MVARLHPGLHQDPVLGAVEAAGQLDLDHRVGAVGNGRAGHDAGRLAHADTEGPVVAGADGSDHVQLDGRAPGVVSLQGVPVHGGVGEAGDRLGGEHGLGQHQAQRLGKIEPASRQGLDPLQHMGPGLVQRDQLFSLLSVPRNNRTILP